MSLESLLASLTTDVSDVSDVQAFSDGGFRCNVTETAAVSDVSPRAGATSPDTADTFAASVPYQRETPPPLGCTSDTGDTAEKAVIRLRLVLEAEDGSRSEATLEVPRNRFDGARVLALFEKHRMAGTTRVVSVTQEAADDRHRCRDCARLRNGVCTAAADIGAAPGYRPTDDLPRRCPGFEETQEKQYG